MEASGAEGVDGEDDMLMRREGSVVWNEVNRWRVVFIRFSRLFLGPFFFRGSFCLLQGGLGGGDGKKPRHLVARREGWG